MKSPVNIKFINGLLLFLVLLDLFLFLVCLMSPPLWIKLMHGIDGSDPLGLIRRLGAVWLAFFVFQLIALFAWRDYTWLLVLVAGIRLTECFSDWIYWFFSDHHTLFGNFGLLVAPPSNLLFGYILIKAFLNLNENNKYKIV
jgi:hypothetical protein